jgi:hypothetical protein
MVRTGVAVKVPLPTSNIVVPVAMDVIEMPEEPTLVVAPRAVPMAAARPVRLLLAADR